MPRSIRSIALEVPSRPSNRAVIEACTLLNSLDANQRRQIEAFSHMAYAERGEVIWLAGSPSEFVAVVGVGFVKMTKATLQGQEVAVELLGPGQTFGLIAAIEGRPFPLSAIAVSNTWYVKIPSNVMIAIYKASDRLKDQIVRSIGPRLRKAHDMMTRLSSGKVEQRIAAVLMLLMGTYGEKIGDHVTLSVALTRQDISEMAGTTVETTIRIMSKWQKQGIVATDHQVITLLNEEALGEILSQC